jgi:hypothetical protein
LWLSQANPYIGLPRGFVYPPTSLPFFGAFTLFNFELAAQLWTVMYISSFVVALLALALTLKRERRYVYISIAVLLLLTSFPFQRMMQLSQSDLLISSLTILSLVSQRLKHQSTSAVLLSMATLLNGASILFLIYFVIFRRDLQYLAHYLFSMLVIVVASLLVVPIRFYWYYVVNVAPTLLGEVVLTDNQSIVGVMSLAGMSKVTSFVSLVGVGLFALLAFYINSNRRGDVFGKRTLRADGMFLMNILVMLLFGPRSTVYAYVWAILPLALFLSALLMEELKLAYLALVGIETFLLNSSPYPYFLFYLGVSVTIVPWVTLGNFMMTLGLIPIYIRPNTIFRNVESTDS